MDPEYDIEFFSGCGFMMVSGTEFIITYNKQRNGIFFIRPIDGEIVDVISIEPTTPGYPVVIDSGPRSLIPVLDDTLVIPYVVASWHMVSSIKFAYSAGSITATYFFS